MAADALVFETGWELFRHWTRGRGRGGTSSESTWLDVDSAWSTVKEDRPFEAQDRRQRPCYLLRRQGYVVEVHGEGRAGSIFAAHCELERVVAGCGEIECADVVNYVHA